MPLGHPFALKNLPSTLPNPDCLLMGHNESRGEAVACHLAIILARCPRIHLFLRTSHPAIAGESPSNDATPQTCCVLPKIVEKRVLAALVEYLYMDVVRSCPPHRLKDLQELAGRDVLDLPRLAALCALQRYQRQIRIGGYIPAEEEAETQRDTNRVTRYSQIPPSSFAVDLLSLLASERFADVTLAAADYCGDDKPSGNDSMGVMEEVLPPGHTAFSWYAQGGATFSGTYVGHTPFTMGAPRPSPQRQTFKAHMFILMRYPFFKVLLSGHFKEEETVRAGKTLRLDTVADASSLEKLLEWIYSGTVRGGLTGDNVADLLRSSQAFGVDDLARNCEIFLLESLDQDNAQDVLTIARENGLSKLAAECEYILSGGQSTM